MTISGAHTTKVKGNDVPSVQPSRISSFQRAKITKVLHVSAKEQEHEATTTNIRILKTGRNGLLTRCSL